MGCKTCSTGEGLEVCLYCGHPFCGLHRGELGGAPACTACLKAEHQRKTRKARGQAASEPGDEERVEPPPPPLLPEPVERHPVAWGAVAAGVTALYLGWFCGWLVERHDLPPWFQEAGAVGGALVAFLGVWAIAKSR